MRAALLAVFLLASLPGCGCARRACAAEMTLEARPGLCEDGFATEIANRCWKRAC